MEFVSGKIKLRTIFLHRLNWLRFFLRYRSSIRKAIVINVLKLLICRTKYLGYQLYKCCTCGSLKKVPHSCKSRFCPSCGKRQTDAWVSNSFDSLPNTSWQHITFTMPDKLWDLFWLNRSIMNDMPSIAANIIKNMAKKQGALPGIFLAIHTFGRQITRNYHLHMSVTKGGLTIKDGYDSWTELFFHEAPVKMEWRKQVINHFRKLFDKGKLKLPKDLAYIQTDIDFRDWTDKFFKYKWHVDLAEPDDNFEKNVHYLGRYLKRPPIGETKIEEYDGNTVSFRFLDHNDKKKKLLKLPVVVFIARLVSHIHDQHFRCIRYYGFLSNRSRGELLPIVHYLLEEKKNPAPNPPSYRSMYLKFIGRDPFKCNCCNSSMEFVGPIYTKKKSLIPWLQHISRGYYPLRE